jgi:putrescine transport system substrate-binding protein
MPDRITQRLHVAVFGALLPALLLAGCGRGDPASGQNVVHVYNWSDYVAPDTLERFERETGIRVVYDVFDSNELLESKLLAGNTGYDVVVPTAPNLERQIGAGVYQRLDRTQLANWRHLDAAMLSKAASHDPGNAYAMPYLWGTTGFGYNLERITERMPDAPLDSWALLFDPLVVARFADCGVALLDAPMEVDDSVRIYLGLDPNTEDEEGVAAVEAALQAIRPYVRYFSSSQYVNDLANGEICLAMGWTGDVLQARDRAREAGKAWTVRYAIPKEGASLFIDMMAIPVDAPHVANAHRFLDFLMRPDVIADITNYTGFANANLAALPAVDPNVRDNASVYPPPEVAAKLWPDNAESDAYLRTMVRMWTRLKAGR